MKHPYAEIELQLSRTIEYLAAVTGADSDAGYGNLYLLILQALEAQMTNHNSYQKPTDQIAADQVTLYVQDQKTGHVYCRSLPLDYHENSNGIVLTGEAPDSRESQIAFLSNIAMEKIRDLTGHGPDVSPCEQE